MKQAADVAADMIDSSKAMAQLDKFIKLSNENLTER